MEKSFWEELIAVWSSTYYTGVFWLFCSLFSLIVGIRYCRKEKSYTLFLLYALSGVLLVNFGCMLIRHSFNLTGIRKTIYSEITNTLFALVEITAFFYLFKKILNTKFINHLIGILWVAFVTICIIFFWKIVVGNATKNQIMNNSYLIDCIEFFMLLPLCLLYFYQLLTKEIRQNIMLSKSPSFWIISGLFFYCVVSLPLLLIGNKLYATDRNLYYVMYSIHYISISFLFLCIAKAFSCKTTLIT